MLTASQHRGSILVGRERGQAEVRGQIVVRRVGDLRGTIEVPGAKNSVLKLMVATILADGTYELSNVPGIADVTIMSELLAAIGITSEAPEPGRLRMINTGDLVPLPRTSRSNGSGRRSTSSARC